MPLCARCRKPFACTCGEESSGELTAVAEECPETKTAAVWVHVVDDRGIDIKGVGTRNDKDGKQTDVGGTAVYDPVDPGPHSVQLDPLFIDHLELYEKPKETVPRTITVVAGQIAYAPYQLIRRPKLSVRVLQKNPRKMLGSATVSVSGTNKRRGDTVDGTGLADLGSVPAGPYDLTVTLGGKDIHAYATTFDFKAAPDKLTLAQAEVREVVVEVEAINVVTANVTMAETVLIIDHWPDNREAAAECVELSLKQTNTAHRYAKAITFKCASDTDVEAFLDTECTEDKKLGGTLNDGVVLAKPEHDDLCNEKTVKVYLRGKSKDGPLSISLDLADPADRFVALGDKAAPVDAEVQLLVRPHVNIAWADGRGVKGVKVIVDPEAAKHPIPESTDDGFAKWAMRGIKPGLYNYALTFPGDVKYLLFDKDDKVVDSPSLDLKPGNESLTYKIKNVEAKLALTCDGEADDVEVKVKVKTVGTAVTLKKGSVATPVQIPVTESDQKCVIETLTLDGTNVYEMVDVEHAS